MTPLSQFERRLRLLKTEVDLDFPGLIQDLEDGKPIIFVTENELTNSAEPDALRRVGGMVLVCKHYGAAVFFVSEKKISVFGEKAASKS